MHEGDWQDWLWQEGTKDAEEPSSLHSREESSAQEDIFQSPADEWKWMETI